MADPAFKEIGLSDRERVEGYRRRRPIEVFECTFTSLFVWRKAEPVYLAERDGCLILLCDPKDGDPWLLPPLGDYAPATLVPELLRMEFQGRRVSGMARVPETMARRLEAAGLSVAHDRDNSDYVYRVSDLATLEGARYSKKRNHVKKALANYRCRYEEITPARIETCRGFLDRWCEARQCGRVPGLCEEYGAIQETLGNFEALGDRWTFSAHQPMVLPKEALRV